MPSPDPPPPPDSSDLPPTVFQPFADSTGPARAPSLPNLRARDPSPIAQGGMGVVRRMTDVDLHRTVVVKSLLPRYLGTEIEDQFITEARLQGRLEHPGIVPIHALGLDEEGRPAAVMKFVDGETLDDVLARFRVEDTPLAERVRRIGRSILQFCDVLCFAHAHEVIHGDLKPANLILGEFGAAYVLDWGIADDLTREASPNVQGTPGYLAPEVAGGTRRPHVGSDVFALGAILYEIVTLERASRATTFAEAAQVIPRDLREDSSQPDHLARIVMKCLAPDPADRYATVSELREELERVILGIWSGRPTHYEAGTFVFREGDPGTTAYVLESGECEVSRLVGKSRVRLAILRAPTAFGEISLLTGQPRSADVQCTTPCTLRPIDRDHFDGLATTNPAVHALTRILSERVVEKDEELIAALRREEVHRVRSDVVAALLRHGPLDWTALLKEIGALKVSSPDEARAALADWEVVVIDGPRVSLRASEDAS